MIGEGIEGKAVAEGRFTNRLYTLTIGCFGIVTISMVSVRFTLLPHVAAHSSAIWATVCQKVG